MPYRDLETRRAAYRGYRLAHREERRAYQRVYNAGHREESRAYQRVYNAAHREERRAYEGAHIITVAGDRINLNALPELRELGLLLKQARKAIKESQRGTR